MAEFIDRAFEGVHARVSLTAIPAVLVHQWVLWRVLHSLLAIEDAGKELVFRAARTQMTRCLS